MELLKTFLFLLEEENDDFFFNKLADHTSYIKAKQSCL